MMDIVMREVPMWQGLLGMLSAFIFGYSSAYLFSGARRSPVLSVCPGSQYRLGGPHPSPMLSAAWKRSGGRAVPLYEQAMLVRDIRSGKTFERAADAILSSIRKDEEEKHRRAERARKIEELRQYLESSEQWDEIVIDVPTRTVRRGNIGISWESDERLKERAREVYMARAERARENNPDTYVGELYPDFGRENGQGTGEEPR